MNHLNAKNVCTCYKPGCKQLFETELNFVWRENIVIKCSRDCGMESDIGTILPVV